MFWRKKHPRPQQQNTHYARLIFQSLLARNPDPRSLDHCSSELDNGLDLRCLVDRITQSGEYLDSHDPNPASADGGRPRVWTDSGYAAYLDEAEIKSILLMKTDHLGDFILALDSFSVFRTAFPAASITLLCGPWNEPLANSLGIFDAVETIDFFASRPDDLQPSFTPEMLGRVGRAHFDLAVDLRVDADTRVAFDHLDATYKCGYASKRCRSPLTISLPRTNYTLINGVANHQRMMMLSLARNVVDFFLPDAELGAAALRRKLAGPAAADAWRGRGKRLVSMQPYSGRAIKNWPVEDFMKLAGWLSGEMNASVVLLGTKSDAADMSPIARACESADVKSAIGQTSLLEAISIIGEADLHIGNDSGLTHVAARMDVPTVAIYSGVAQTELWAPYGRHVTVINAPVACSPCHLMELKDCQNGRKCIEVIDFEFVRSEVRKRLA